MAVQVWERMMQEHAEWVSPVDEEQHKDIPESKTQQQEQQATQNNTEGKKGEKEKALVVHTAGAMKSDGSSIYKLPIGLSDFMNQLKQKLGVRWDDHARETSIRFFKQARNLCGRAPRYDQLDLNDFEDEQYAKEMALRKTEDKVIWSHRDSVRAVELRQQAYESQLDSLGLKILNRRLRRDYAERKKRDKYNERMELIQKMETETIKQNARQDEIWKERNRVHEEEQIVLKQQMDAKMKIWRLNNSKNAVKQTAVGGFVLSVDDVESGGDSMETVTQFLEVGEWGEGGMVVPEEQEEEEEEVGGGRYYSRRRSAAEAREENEEEERFRLESAKSSLLDDGDLMLLNREYPIRK